MNFSCWKCADDRCLGTMVSLLIGLLYASLQLPLDNRENKNSRNVCLSQIRGNIFPRKFLPVKISTYTVYQGCDLSGFFVTKISTILSIFSPILCVFSPILHYFSGFFYYFQDFSWKANHTSDIFTDFFLSFLSLYMVEDMPTVAWPSVKKLIYIRSSKWCHQHGYTQKLELVINFINHFDNGSDIVCGTLQQKVP